MQGYAPVTRPMDGLLDKLTLAIPVYNDARYLPETIESCIGQAGRVMLYDNASTDGSSELCQAAAEQYASVTHHRQPENVGALENFKQPLFACTTDYFGWVGSHDLLGPGYGPVLVRALEARPDATLACGVIQHIDEEGEPLRRTESDWLTAERQKTPLDGIELLAHRLRDCFIFHGVHRTPAIRQAWFDEPCLGSDRIALFREIAIGPFLYMPSVTFHARDFPNTRDSRQDRERRSKTLGSEAAKPLKKSNFVRNRQLMLTALENSSDDASLTQALRIVGKVERRHHARKRYQRLRYVQVVGGLLAAAVLVFLALT